MISFRDSFGLHRLLLFIVLYLPSAIAFSIPSATIGRPTGCAGHSVLHSNAKDTGDDLFSSSSNNDDDMAALLQSLQNRRLQLEEDQASKRNAMLTASACTSTIAVVLPTWVRRLDVDFPLVVCGSSASDIYVAHVETGKVLGIGRAAATDVASPKISAERLAHVLQRMFGDFDGGGTLAIAVQGNLVCEAGRSGSVNVWRLDQPKDEKDASVSPMFQGFMPALEGRLVTALRIADGCLYAGTDDGKVEAYSLSNLPVVKQPEYSWKVGDGAECVVLDLDVDVESGMAVVATDSGSVDILSLDDVDTNKPIASFTLPNDRSDKKQDGVFPTSCCIVESSTPTNASGGGKSYIVACASNAGNVYLKPIIGDMDRIDDDQTPTFGPEHTELSPRHFGSVQCMTSPLPGILVTGAHDGTIRVWNADEHVMQYQFVGYKVWLGSLHSDGVRIISDGADNTIITHVFEPTAASDNSSSSETRDDERSEDR